MKNRDSKTTSKKSRAPKVPEGNPTEPVAPPPGMVWRLRTFGISAILGQLGVLELWDERDLRRATRAWWPVAGLEPEVAEVAHSAKYLRSTSIVVLQKWHDMQRQQAIARIDHAIAELGIKAANTRHDADVDNHDPRTAP